MFSLVQILAKHGFFALEENFTSEFIINIAIKHSVKSLIRLALTGFTPCDENILFYGMGTLM